MKGAPWLFMAGLCFTVVAQAQAPAGSPDNDEGSASSPSGSPGMQEEIRTKRNPEGRVTTEDGHPVNTRDGNHTNDGKRDGSPEHSSPGGPTDPGSDPGELD